MRPPGGGSGSSKPSWILRPQDCLGLRRACCGSSRSPCLFQIEGSGSPQRSHSGGVSGSHFTGSSFFSGGANFGNGAARSASRGVQFSGQRLNHRANRDSAVAARGLKSNSSKAVARVGRDSVRAQAAAKKALPEFATRSRTINVGGDQGITAKVNPDPSARVIGAAHAGCG